MTDQPDLDAIEARAKSDPDRVEYSADLRLIAEVRKLREALDKCGRTIRQNRHASYRLNRVSEIVSQALKGTQP